MVLETHTWCASPVPCVGSGKRKTKYIYIYILMYVFLSFGLHVLVRLTVNHLHDAKGAREPVEELVASDNDVTTEGSFWHGLICFG